MKTFTTAYNAAKNTKIGAKLVWIMVYYWPVSGTMYISDQAFSLPTWKGGITTKSLVAEWGQIREDLALDQSAIKISDFSLKIINDPNGTPKIETVLWDPTNNINTTKIELYRWFRGLDDTTDPPVLRWVGNVKDFQEISETLFQVDFQDQTEAIDKYVGEKITLAAHPSADPDDVGKVGTIGYGVLIDIPALALDAGAQTSLPNNINSTVETFYVSDGSRLAVGKVIQIDEEKMLINTFSGDQVIDCDRHYGGTTAAIHLKGAGVWEVKTVFVYELLHHPMKSIGKIYGKVGDKKMDITSICTKYTGQTGSELTGYEGKAVVTIPGYITVSQAVDLLVNDGLEIADAMDLVNTLTANDTLSVADTIGISNPTHTHGGSSGGNQAGTIDSSYLSFGSIYENINSQSFTLNFYVGDDLGGTGTYEAWITGDQISTIVVYKRVGSNVLINMSSLILGPSNPGCQSAYFQWHSDTHITITWSGGIRNYVFDQDVDSATQNTTKTGGAVIAGSHSFLTGSCVRGSQVVRTGTINLSGNSVANTLIGDSLLFCGEGWPDIDGSITGSAGAIIERPDHVMKHLNYQYGAWPLADFYTNAGTQFTSKGYKFAGVINTYEKLMQWNARLAWQCRCYFRLAEGKMQLLWRPDSLTSSKTITKYMTRMDEAYKRNLGPRPSPLDEVINKISVHFDRDWTQSGKDAYKQVTIKVSNPTSITRHSEKEKDDLFYFDFVTILAMAEDVRDFYLARYKEPNKMLFPTMFWDNMELEFGDGVTMTELGSLLCEIQAVNDYPGSGRQQRNDRFYMTLMEY